MSRPFSYSDENFTVIGNVLFFHFKFDKDAERGTLMIEIPTKIVDRLLFYTTIAKSCFGRLEASAGYFGISIKKYNGKYYFYNVGTDIRADKDRYVVGLLILKDI